MNRKLLSKLGLFASLYVSLGIPHGFFVEAAPVIFRQRGLSQDKIGLLTLFFIPWILKFLWAPLVDRFFIRRFGRRRSWIVPMQVLSILVVISLSWWEADTPLIYLAFAILFINLFASTQDAATDGYAIELLPPRERGWGNGVQTGGYWAGYILGGGLILVLQSYIGWQITFYLMAGIIFMAMIPVLTRSEPPVPEGVESEPFIKTVAHMFRDFKRFLLRRHVPRIIMIVVIARMGTGFGQQMSRTMMVDLGFSLDQIGWMMGIAGPVAGLAGAAFGGLISNPLGRRRALLLALGLQILPFAGYMAAAFSGTDNQWILVTLIAFYHFVASLVMVPLFAFMMDWSSPVEGASEYTFMDCCSIFGIIATSILAGFITNAYGYAANFATGLIFTLVALILLHFLYRPGLVPKDSKAVS